MYVVAFNPGSLFCKPWQQSQMQASLHSWTTEELMGEIRSVIDSFTFESVTMSTSKVFIVGIFVGSLFGVLCVSIYLWLISSKHINSWQLHLHSCLPHVLRLFGIRRPARSPTWEHGNLAVWPKDVPLETWHYLRSENTVVPKPKPWDGLIFQNVGGLGGGWKVIGPLGPSNIDELVWNILVRIGFKIWCVHIWHLRCEILCAW